MWWVAFALCLLNGFCCTLFCALCVLNGFMCCKYYIQNTEVVVYCVKVLHNVLDLAYQYSELSHHKPKFFTKLHILPPTSSAECTRVAHQYFVFISLSATVLYNTIYFFAGN